MTTGANAHPSLGDPDLAAYWSGLEAGKLLVRRCGNCERNHLPPSPSCPHCGSADDLTDIESSGHGRIYTWVVAHYAFNPARAADVPYVIAGVDLDDGGRAFGRLAGVDVDANLTGLAVVARPQATRSDTGLPELVFEGVEAHTQ